MEPEEQDREFLVEKEELTPFDIVDLLRSEDGNARAKAMNELYPGMTVTMVTVHKSGQMGMASTRTSNIFQLWTMLCWAAGFVGNQLGMTLQWGPKPGGSDGKIVVARPGQTPMMK